MKGRRPPSDAQAESFKHPTGTVSVSTPLPVWLREVLVENVLKLFHDVVHVDGDQAAVLLQRLFKNTWKMSNTTKI